MTCINRCPTNYKKMKIQGAMKCVANDIVTEKTTLQLTTTTERATSTPTTTVVPTTKGFARFI